MKQLIALLIALTACGDPYKQAEEDYGVIEQASGATFDDAVALAHWHVTIDANYALPCGLTYREFTFSNDTGYYPATLYNPGCPWWIMKPTHHWAGTPQFPGEQYLIGAWKCPQGSWWVDNSLTLFPNPDWNDWFVLGGVYGSYTRIARNAAGAVVCQKTVSVTAAPL